MEKINVPLQLINQEAIVRWLGDYWWVALILVIWTIVWKGLALWKAARANRNAWFVVLLILNTVGLVDLVYYFFIDNDKKK